MVLKIYDKRVKPYRGWPENRHYICIETNLAWAVPYWTARKKQNKNLVMEYS